MWSFGKWVDMVCTARPPEVCVGGVGRLWWRRGRCGRMHPWCVTSIPARRTRRYTRVTIGWVHWHAPSCCCRCSVWRSHGIPRWGESSYLRTPAGRRTRGQWLLKRAEARPRCSPRCSWRRLVRRHKRTGVTVGSSVRVSVGIASIVR